jgi:hypothetical protein
MTTVCILTIIYIVQGVAGISVAYAVWRMYLA